jgi:hypothetical protein
VYARERTFREGYVKLALQLEKGISNTDGIIACRMSGVFPFALLRPRKSQEVPA